ncbi:MAG: Hint domain-containing protein, partial [Acetobacteraceae bacterium]|nr:Hint domain-containing protein [Acetobacteraceae bacterium]
MSADLIPAALRQPAIGDGSFPVGTPIAVPSADGAPTEMAVEALARGDMVLTLAGPVAVRHVGRSRQDPPELGPDAPPRPRLIPIRVAAGAFGEGQPVMDLLLPPQQAVHVLDAGLPDGALVALGALVNGATIRREPVQAPIHWVRLELERPGVVIAAGLLVAARHDPTAPPPAAFLPPGPAVAALRARLARAATPAPAEPAPTERVTTERVTTERVTVDLVMPDLVMAEPLAAAPAADATAAQPVED